LKKQISANAGNDQLLCLENTSTLEGNQPISGEGLWTILSGSGTIENPANPTTLVTDLGIGENTLCLDYYTDKWLP
jgi:hypothetical protein